jgi:23S rRNA (cytidine1920-2'-O)/16S rRNA (cytidine1409-2'-O)-methyltransferase
MAEQPGSVIHFSLTGCWILLPETSVSIIYVLEKKRRLDLLLIEKGLVKSRQRARSLIMAGKVLVNDQTVDKPGFFVSSTDTLGFRGEDIPYVSRGGLKLEAALNNFKLNASGSVCLDVGASTGGFTDCLLQHGAQRVYAVDVGYGQLAWKIRQDARVIVIERTNIRHMPADAIPEPVDLATIDVSFISLKIVVPAVAHFIKPAAFILALIKPQFEVGKGRVGKGGVVREPELHRRVITELSDFFTTIKLTPEAVYPSPLLGPKGNREFFILLRP